MIKAHRTDKSSIHFQNVMFWHALWSCGLIPPLNHNKLAKTVIRLMQSFPITIKPNRSLDHSFVRFWFSSTRAQQQKKPCPRKADTFIPLNNHGPHQLASVIGKLFLVSRLCGFFVLLVRRNLPHFACSNGLPKRNAHTRLDCWIEATTKKPYKTLPSAHSCDDRRVRLQLPHGYRVSYRKFMHSHYD